MESVPADIDFEQVRTSIESMNKIKEVSDLHIWQSDSKDKFLSAHIEIDNVDNSQRNKILADIQNYYVVTLKLAIPHFNWHQ